jgi:hypothetical protein
LSITFFALSEEVAISIWLLRSLQQGLFLGHNSEPSTRHGEIIFSLAQNNFRPPLEAYNVVRKVGIQFQCCVGLLRNTRLKCQQARTMIYTEGCVLLNLTFFRKWKLWGQEGLVLQDEVSGARQGPAPGSALQFCTLMTARHATRLMKHEIGLHQSRELVTSPFACDLRGLLCCLPFLFTVSPV